MSSSVAVIPEKKSAVKFAVPQRVKVIAWIVGIVVILIIAIFAWIKISGKLKEQRERKKVNYIENGGAIRPNFSPGTYADKMFNVMDGVWTLATTKGEAARELMQLTDNELIDVHNYWNQTLYDRNGETMYKMMKAEWNIPEITFGGENVWQALLNRLSRLGLISK